MCLQNLKLVVIPVLEITVIEVLDGRCERPILGKRIPYDISYDNCTSKLMTKSATRTFYLSLLLLLLRAQITSTTQ